MNQSSSMENKEIGQAYLPLSLSLCAYAFHSSPIASIIIHREAGLVEANQHFSEIFGAGGGRPGGAAAAYASLSPPFLRRLWQEGMVEDFQVELTDAGGNTHPVLVSGAVLESWPDPLAVLHFAPAVTNLDAPHVVITDNERQHMVQILHDNLQQMLYALTLQLQLAQPSESSVRSIIHDADVSLREIMRTARELGRELASLPLRPAPSAGSDDSPAQS